MPLPDERPRQQSVANLIGRYEKAAKRSSLSNPTSPAVSRATSVVSHLTGDSASIEAKERREWPPKSDSDTNLGPTEAIAQPLLGVQDALRSLSDASQDRGALVTPPPEALSDPIAAQPPAEDVFTETQPETPTQSKPVPPQSVSPVSPKKTQPPVKAVGGRITNSKSAPDTRATRAPAQNTVSKPSTASKSSTVSKPTAASATPAPPRSAPVTPSKAQATSAKPLKAQHTGTSASTVRAKSRLGAKSPPTRAKTPTANLRASTSGSGSASASVSPSRPKTPYSNLHAPTQASLARARDAQPPPPPVRKATLSASSLDRLAKPTAASASKARALAASPPRAAAAKPARREPPPATLKPRVGLAPARLKAEREKKEKEAAVKKAGPAKAAAGVAPAALSTSNSNGEVPVKEDTVPEHAEEEYIEQPSFISDVGGESEAPLLDSPSHSHEELEHDEVAVEGAVGNGDDSEIESYDDAYASEIDGHLPLDSAHIQGAGEGSFAFTPEPEVREPSPAIPDIAADIAAEVAPNADADVVEEEKQEEIVAEPENGHIFENEPKEVEKEALEVLVLQEPSEVEIENGLSNGTEAALVQVTATDELESLVNMLEAKVSLRPASATGSEASEAPGTIPDDDLLG